MKNETTKMKIIGHIEQNIKVEITQKSCKVGLINVFVLQKSGTSSKNALENSR